MRGIEEVLEEIVPVPQLRYKLQQICKGKDHQPEVVQLAKSVLAVLRNVDTKQMTVSHFYLLSQAGASSAEEFIGVSPHRSLCDYLTLLLQEVLPKEYAGIVSAHYEKMSSDHPS